LVSSIFELYIRTCVPTQSTSHFISLKKDGFGDAAEVRVGFRMGSGQIAIAKSVAEKSVYFGIVVAIFESGAFFILAKYIPRWLTPDPTLQKMLFDLIPMIGFGQILMVAGMEAWAGEFPSSFKV
jgi:Na+-driven multidrug efflux pump